MLIFADVAGVVLRAASEAEILDIPVKANPPAGTAFSLRFPDETNDGLVQALKSQNFGGYTMPGGTLTTPAPTAVPATVNYTAANNRFPDIALIDSAVTKLRQYPQIDGLTGGEQSALFRDALRRAGRLGGTE